MVLNKNRKTLSAIGYISTIILLISSLSGCQSLSGFYNTAPHADSYKSVLKEWTREGSVYSGFDLEASVVVTYKSEDYRAAWVEEYAVINGLSDAEKARLMDDQMAAAKEYHEFFGAAYVPERDLNDLNEKKPSWKIFLKVDGKNKVKPVEIRKIRNEDASYEYFFPYLTPWKTPYIVRFPVMFPGTDENIIDEDSTNIAFIITGPRGKVKMEWELK